MDLDGGSFTTTNGDGDGGCWSGVECTDDDNDDNGIAAGASDGGLGTVPGRRKECWTWLWKGSTQHCAVLEIYDSVVVVDWYVFGYCWCLPTLLCLLLLKIKLRLMLS